MLPTELAHSSQRVSSLLLGGSENGCLLCWEECRGKACLGLRDGLNTYSFLSLLPQFLTVGAGIQERLAQASCSQVSGDGSGSERMQVTQVDKAGQQEPGRSCLGCHCTGPPVKSEPGHLSGVVTRSRSHPHWASVSPTAQ